jgi:hypothetical protein
MCIENHSDGDVSTANAAAFIAPITALPDNAHAEKTINVCPQGRRTVKNPNKNVGRGCSLRSNSVKVLEIFPLPNRHLLGTFHFNTVPNPATKMTLPKIKLVAAGME